MSSLFTRVSIRKFEPYPVKDSEITQILRAAMQAPSAGNQQPWEFYVVRNPKLIELLSQASPYAKCAAEAPVVIVCAYRTEGLRFPQYAQIDLSIAQENMWLMTDELGLGGVWLGIAPDQDRMDYVAQTIRLPQELKAFSLFALGYPAQEKEQQDRFDESRIHYIS